MIHHQNVYLEDWSSQKKLLKLKILFQTNMELLCIVLLTDVLRRYFHLCLFIKKMSNIAYYDLRLLLLSKIILSIFTGYVCPCINKAYLICRSFQKRQPCRMICLAHQIYIEDTIIVDLVEPHFKVTCYYLGYYRVALWFSTDQL